mmetsp:Transcript_28713/g.80268  ORF Transcript_28713/g.80268 Transcript_28713/m.80268 type:complete len:219 (+) Transcript_28713:125-781(+)
MTTPTVPRRCHGDAMVTSRCLPARGGRVVQAKPLGNVVVAPLQRRVGLDLPPELRHPGHEQHERDEVDLDAEHGPLHVLRRGGHRGQHRERHTPQRVDPQLPLQEVLLGLQAGGHALDLGPEVLQGSGELFVLLPVGQGPVEQAHREQQARLGGAESPEVGLQRRREAREHAGQAEACELHPGLRAPQQELGQDERHDPEPAILQLHLRVPLHLPLAR